jgi:Protein of unknown function (DUF3631)
MPKPDMPVEDRAADTWEPLIAVAEAAGGHWPKTARAACKALVAGADAADEDDSLSIKLLVNIKQVFTAKKVSFLPSADLVAELRRLEESPWGEFEFNPSKLAHWLKNFGVKPGRDTTGTTRGYRLEDFTDAFQRYTRQNPSEPSESVEEQRESSDGQEASDRSGCQTESTRQDETPASAPFLTGLTASDDRRAEKASRSCPECPQGVVAAPVRTDSGLCDFCTQRRRKQMTDQRTASITTGRKAN